MSLVDLLKEKIEKQLSAYDEQLEAAQRMPRPERLRRRPMWQVRSWKRSCCRRSMI